MWINDFFYRASKYQLLKRKRGDQPNESYKKTIPIEKRRKMFQEEFVAPGLVPRESIPIIPDSEAFIHALDIIKRISEPHVVFVCQEVIDKLIVLKRPPKKNESEIHLSKQALATNRKKFENDTRVGCKAQRACIAIEYNLLKNKFYASIKLLKKYHSQRNTNADIIIGHALNLREKGIEPILLTSNNFYLRTKAGIEKFQIYDVNSFKKETHFFE